MLFLGQYCARVRRGALNGDAALHFFLCKSALSNKYPEHLTPMRTEECSSLRKCCFAFGNVIVGVANYSNVSIGDKLLYTVKAKQKSEKKTEFYNRIQIYSIIYCNLD